MFGSCNHHFSYGVPHVFAGPNMWFIFLPLTSRFLTADLSGTTLPAADFVFSKVPGGYPNGWRVDENRNPNRKWIIWGSIPTLGNLEMATVIRK